jgi:murein DD-endopeptidase MepM/ murein hydrolase activator NlpD
MISTFAPHQSLHSPMFGMNSATAASSQMMMLAQMMQMMLGLMQMMFGQQQTMSAGHPGFGGGMPGSSFGPSSAGFLGMPYGMNSGSGNSSSSPNSGSFGAPSGGSAGASSANVGPPQSAGGGYVKPLDGNFRVSSGFGPRRAPTAGASTFHKGVDLAAPTGTPVRAVKPGRISISQHQMSGGRSTGYGNWIEVKHDDGTSSRYGHLNSRDVKVGQRIEAGQVLGTVGNTGTSTGAHLHFEIRNSQGQAVDPQKVMKF